MARSDPLTPRGKVTRRGFTSAALIGLAPKSDTQHQGGFVFESQDQGHRIRDKARFQNSSEVRRIPVVIAGGGIAGLCAAWRLNQRGMRDFVLLEMEAEAGGNARSGRNEVSAYPWAAHYVPLPGGKSPLVRELFTDLGLLRDGNWDERWLCHSPQERLFLHGQWQEGLEPQAGMRATDRSQFAEFEQRMSEFHGSGGFTIPSAAGRARATAAQRALDGITMRDWMDRVGLHSRYLRWYVDYACRDDYGTSLDSISAWAGIHYFAARESEGKGPLTWPEGNGWIVQRLMDRVGRYVQTRRMIHRIERDGRRWMVCTEGGNWLADSVIFALPTFLAAWLIHPAPPAYPVESAPWITANLTMDRWPAEQDGQEPAWDNVIYDSPSLGYVVATHQNLNVHQPRTVWTWYHAFARGLANDQRRVLLGGDWPYWKEFVLRDLERAHSDIRQAVRRIDIFRIGHAMPRPAPGTVFGAPYPGALQGSLFFAHSDTSRLALFEEAQAAGTQAADRALALVGMPAAIRR